MTNFIKNVCVYSSSSTTLDEKYYQIAEELGALMGKAGYNVVYGGGKLGMMYRNAAAVKANGGLVTGIIPEKLYEFGLGNPECDKLIITKCMRTRKEKLDEMSDAMITLPGGLGTLEEFSEMIVQKQLGYCEKAIVILNTDGFYDDLIKFINVIIKEHFAIAQSTEFFYVAKTPQEVIDYLKQYQPIHVDVQTKWNNANLVKESKV